MDGSEEVAGPSGKRPEALATGCSRRYWLLVVPWEKFTAIYGSIRWLEKDMKLNLFIAYLT